MNKTAKKVGKIVLNSLLYAFLAICIFLVFVTVVSKRDSDGAAEIFGYQMRVVVSDSMAANDLTDVSEYEIKDIPIRSMVFVQVMPEDPAEATAFYRGLKVGDVLTFRYVYTSQVTITHRITSITEKDTGGFLIELAGDNKTSDNGQLYQTIDTSIPNNMNYVIGKVVGRSLLLGALLSFLLQPVGLVLLIIVPCLIIILLEVLKIIKMFADEKKKKVQDEVDQKDRELEELRSRLAALENQSKQPTIEEENEIIVPQAEENEAVSEEPEKGEETE